MTLPWTFVAFVVGVLVGLAAGGVAVVAILIDPAVAIAGMFVVFAFLFLSVWAWERGS